MNRMAGQVFGAMQDPRKLDFASQFGQHAFNRGTIDSAEAMGDYQIKTAENQGELQIMQAEAQGKIGAAQQSAQNQAGLANSIFGAVKGFAGPIGNMMGGGGGGAIPGVTSASVGNSIKSGNTWSGAPLAGVIY